MLSKMSSPPPYANNNSTVHFRSDLDEAQQHSLLEKDRLKSSAAFHLAEWKATCGSKRDHAVFIKMLIVEAHRQNPNVVQCADVKRYFSVVQQAVDADSQDPYAALLGRFSLDRLFNKRMSSKGEDTTQTP